MADVLAAVKHLCRVLLFFSQLYGYFERGSIRSRGSAGQPGKVCYLKGNKHVSLHIPLTSGFRSRKGRSSGSWATFLLPQAVSSSGESLLVSLNSEHFEAEAQALKDQPPSSTISPSARATELPLVPDYIAKCPSNGLCIKLPADCMTCNLNYSCTYGKPAIYDCKIKPQVMCVDDNHQKQESFTINMTCQLCWQLPPSEYECSKSNSSICKTVTCPRQRYNATCTVKDHVYCLGRRVFPKMLFCNWTGGYKWSTALALSITLGGFGADRFYLGQWREGLGKLFSFGGLGIWTLIDVFLICVGYVGPADGSLYI